VTRLRIGFIALVTLAWAGRSIAAEDGGAQSVFAVPAGNRGLAMGGAFAAVANDASAMLWNPGALGGLTQAEVQFSQATLEGPGFHESFAGVALPRWRWGVMGLTLRQFAAGDMEQRDDRNVLLATGLSDRETEFALGYGSSIGDAWDLGVVGKLRRQDVGGRSGGGVGADLGVRVRPGLALGFDSPWIRDLAIGLAFTNAIEPTVRLDQESVPDPATARLGVALAHPAFTIGSFTVALDVEKSRAAGVKLHAGLEVEPVTMFALRTGLSDGALTAGTSLRWGAAALDYVFEDTPVGATHRAGLAIHFGKTVDEARQAAEQAQEQNVQARLAEIERIRESERIAALLEQASRAHADGELDEALQVLAMLRTLDPNRADARQMEAACERERAAQLESSGDFTAAAITYGRALALMPDDSVAALGRQRSRLESDRRAARSAEIRQRFASALDAFGRDSLAAAREGFAGILAIAPADSESRAMIERVDLAIGRRVAGLLQQTGDLIQGGRLKDAADLLTLVRALDPRARGLAATEAALLGRQQEMAAGRPAQTERARRRANAGPDHPVSPALTAAQQHEIADLYRRGVMAMEQGRADDAVRYWELVRSMQPGYERVDQYLVREYQTRGMEAFAAGRLEEAVSIWEKARGVDPGDVRTLGYLARAREQLARTKAISAGDTR
jgi:tetratricopeptide (TPR) repeat protein